MAKVWLTDLWLKDEILRDNSGKIIKRLPPSRAEMNSLADFSRHKVSPRHQSSRFGKGSRFRVGVAVRSNGRTIANYKSFNSKAAAEDYMLSVGGEISSGEYIPSQARSLFFASVADQWLSTKHSIAQSTLCRIKGCLRLYVLPKWGEVKIGDITELDCHKWINELMQSGMSASYLRQIVTNTFGAILNYASSQKVRYIKFSPLEDVRLPKRNSNSREIAFLNETQVFSLANAAYKVEGETSAILILVLAYTGVRIGEATCLRVRDIDFNTRRIHISKTWSRGEKYKPFIKDTKNGKPRKVPVPTFLLPKLQSIARAKDPQDFLFEIASQRGLTHIDSGNWRVRVWNKAKDLSGLGNMKDLTIHSLRHTCASLAIKAGADVKTLQAMLGHADAAITLNTYAGLFPDSLDLIADKMAIETLQFSKMMPQISI